MENQSGQRRVLQICHHYNGPFLDYARQYASLFEGTPFKVTTVFLTGESSDEVAAKCQSDEIIFLDYKTSELGGLKLRAIRDLRKIAQERNFSLCIAHRSKPAYIGCIATKLPVLWIHHVYGAFNRLARRLFAQAFQKRISLIAVSDAVRDDIREHLGNWPDDRIHTLYNRIDIPAVQANQFDRQDARRQLKLPEDAWIVGNVGRLHPDKDQTTLIKGFAAAIPDLPANAQLAILGRGRLENELKALAMQLNISNRVFFIGEVPDARRFFRAFDVFVLSSDHEPFGMVLLEAMAAGVPLICSDCGGAREVVDGSGLLFRLGDGLALAECLVKVAGLNEQEYEDQREAMQLKLNTQFSDSAARSQFWAMSVLDS
ncbi:MAG TPA: glycosyltransferase [Pseudomonas xinjiangensis]|uniref:Glycosyltransferase n=2 Tax=root TaxID=1 RepID=A0A7V1FSZ3_9GAMM|nr:glycosyltransferase [Halopseudomonas xinjiangensis]HEC49501.1 glycosyltransferase [Halopseudomonas xinjiangensis]